MENQALQNLLYELRTEEERRIIELTKQKDREMETAEHSYDVLVQLDQRARELSRFMLESYQRQQKRGLLSRFIGKSGLSLVSGSEQWATELGYRNSRSTRIHAPYLDTPVLMNMEVPNPPGYEGYRFTTGLVVRTQIMPYITSKNVSPERLLSAKREWHSAYPLAIFSTVMEEVTGKTEKELKYLITEPIPSPIKQEMPPIALNVYHDWQPAPLLGESEAAQIEILGLLNSVFEELKTGR
jgi:hypothetical protein